MERAIALAWNGWGRVHPNPMVGAVLLRDGETLSEAWHTEYGQEHAEVVGLREAGARGRGATLVVSLEPCSHRGKQSPCTEAILAGGVRRVVFGSNDPNPEAGGGAAWLVAHGVEVSAFPAADAVARQNAPFFHRFRHPDRPFVAVKLATSVDGRVADYSGRSRWLSGPVARQWVHWLRAGFDAVAVGGRTARADDPSLTVRGLVAPRTPPRRIVFDRSGDLSGASQLLSTAREVPVTVVAERALGRDAAAGLADSGVDLLVATGLKEAMARLREGGIESVLVEGGGRLAGRLLGEGLVDRFYWVQCPLWLGEEGIHAFAGLASPLLEQASRWQVVERKPLDLDTLLVLDRPTQEEGQG